MSLPLKEGWDRISANYQRRSGIPTDEVYWGDFVATESQLGILGSVKGARVLEIGCGAAQNSIALSKWGAATVGLDLSPRQIHYGQRLVRRENAEVNLVVGNMEALPFKNRSFNIVTTAVSLHYAPNLGAVVGETNRVLTKDGLFVFSIAHPFSEGRLVRHRGKRAVALRNYFSRRVVRWVDKLPDGSRVKMHSYYRTLQDYFDALIGNGFVVQRYLELERLDENALHPLDKDRIRKEKEAKQQYRIMKDVPYWVVFKACKRRARAHA